MKTPMLVVVTCACLAGCAMRHPMGLSTEQWNALPPEKQAELQTKQYAIDAERQQQQEAQRLEQQRYLHEQALAKAEATRQAYARAQYGDVVNVVVQGGSLQYNRRLYPYEPVSFDLIKGETKSVPFLGRGMQTVATHYDVRLSDDGNTLYFDDSSQQRAVFVNHDWEHGETYRPAATMNDVSVGLSGMTFYVKLKGLPGAPTKMIIENR